MDHISVGGHINDTVPSPVDLVRLCRQRGETTVPILDSKTGTSPVIISGGPNCGNSAVESPDVSIEHRLNIPASTEVIATSTMPSPSFSGLSPVSAGDVFQGGLFDPKTSHLSPFVDDFRPHQQCQTSNVWCPPAANGGQMGPDLSFFSDGPSSCDAERNGALSGVNNKKTASDKTPMCLIADLARYNDVPHQYKLINEGGPAHQKDFTVALTVGEGAKQEEFIARGPSIKKAQQAAAQKALDETKFPKRPLRFSHKHRPTATTYGYCSMGNASLTPTVMLNALAMKIGAIPEYTFLVSSPLTPFPHRLPPVFHGSMMGFYPGSPFAALSPTPPFNPFAYPPPMPFPRFPPVLAHYVKLKVGTHEFLGQGPNRQLAKHDASLKALRALEPLVQNREQKEKEEQAAISGQKSEELEESKIELEGRAAAKPDEVLAAQPSAVKGGHETPESKSPINVVYEFALKRRLEVNFEVVSETGPAHKRHFLIKCVVNGPLTPILTSDGEGFSKKMAKHDAAEKMIKKLKESVQILPSPMTFRQQQEQQAQQKALKEKKRKMTIIKDLKSDPSYGQEINPVSRLIQVQQAKKAMEPVFEFVGEDGHARCKEFIMKWIEELFGDSERGERLLVWTVPVITRYLTIRVWHTSVTVGDKSREGKGPNKKLAKRAAAEAMLETLGYAKPLPTPGRPVLKHRQTSPSESSPEVNARKGAEDRAVENTGNEDHANGSQQSEKRRVQFQLSDDAKRRDSLDDNDDDENRNGNYRFGRRSRGGRRLAPGLLFLPSAFADCDTFDCRTTTSPADLDAGGQAETETSYGTWSDMQTSTSSSSPPASDSAKEQLGYLANLFSFQVEFTDFPKSLRNGEHLCLVSLSMTPPLVCHGGGPSVQQAQNEAALAALRSLAGKGLKVSLEGETAMANDLAVERPAVVSGTAPEVSKDESN